MDAKERAVELELVQRVHRLGGLAEKVTTLSDRGFFDRLVILPGGRVVFVEIKRPSGGRISAHQEARHQRYQELGAEVAIICDSAGIDVLLS